MSINDVLARLQAKGATGGTYGTSQETPSVLAEPLPYKDWTPGTSGTAKSREPRLQVGEHADSDARHSDLDACREIGEHRTEANSAIEQALAVAVAGLFVTSDELRAELSGDDIAAWHAAEIGSDNLRAFAQAMQVGRDRRVGRIPEGYEEIATCKRCGPVWLFTDGTVPSCPWCINRMAGWPIPRPDTVTCIDCRHFERTAHPHLGRCAAGVKPYNPSGRWWDTDRHSCGRWLPKAT